MAKQKFKKQKKIFYVLALLALVAGLLMTFISWLEICSESCNQVHFYKFYGLDFSILGFLYFPIVIAAHLYSRRSELAGLLASILIAGGVGMEINFIRVQKFVIGQWCPVCLSIAACIAIAAIIYIVDATLTASRGNKGDKAMFIQKSVATFIFMLAGFFISLVGVAKPEKTFADGVDGGKSPAFGNPNSNIEVYVVTDWFCEACQGIEPRLDRIYPVILPQVRLYFVDYSIHPESMNYTPYNLSFMINNKDQYIKIRHALHQLANRTLAPTTDDVKKAVQPLGVKYKQLNYTDIDSGVRFFKGIAKSFNINQTPTVVVANRKSLKAKKLVGDNEITEQNVLNAIHELQ